MPNLYPIPFNCTVNNAHTTQQIGQTDPREIESLTTYSSLLKHSEKVDRSGMEESADRRRKLLGRGAMRLERYRWRRG